MALENPIQIFLLKENKDQRGSMTELIREDWFMQEACGAVRYMFDIQQAMLSVCKPGVVKAWHRHTRGQNDALVVLKGTIELVVYDGHYHSMPAIDRMLLYYPGHLWHGLKVIGDEEAWILYFVNRLYDYDNPDEERLPPDHKFNGEAYPW